MYECKLWPILDLSLYLFYFSFFLSISFLLATIIFFDITLFLSFFRLNRNSVTTADLTVRCVSVCILCAAIHANTYLTMMFLWFFGWREYNKFAVLFIQYEYVSVSCWSVVRLSRCVLLLFCFGRGITIRRYWQNCV